MKIEELDFSVRTYNTLKRGGINTVEELSKLSDNDLMKIRNFGTYCLREVHEKLEKIGGSENPMCAGSPVLMENRKDKKFLAGERSMKERIVAYLKLVSGAAPDTTLEDAIKLVEEL